jgi:hypothetical protein
MIIEGILYVCVSLVAMDSHKFHHPEVGIGHVAYSRSLGFADLAMESENECETAHVGMVCKTYCYESRSPGNDAG